jgi:hypothetical protein
MRRVTLIAAVVAALAGLGVVAPSVHAGCAVVVVLHDRVYIAYGGPSQTSTIEPGAPIDGVVEPGCNDTVGADEHPTAVAARRIAGVSAGVAILVRGTPLVASGYLPDVSPFLTSATLPHDEARGCRLGGRVRITGPAHVGLGLLNVTVQDSTVPLRHLAGGAAQVFPDGYTRIGGLVRNGLPYIGEGQRVRVDARFCKVPGSIGTKIIARRIVPAGPIVPPATAEDILGEDWRGSPGVVSGRTGGHSLAVAIVVVLAAGGIGAALVAHRRRSLPPGTG